MLELEAALSARRLTISTTVRATEDAAVPLAFGFHPYLRLPGVPRERWQVTLPPRRHLILDERGIPIGTGGRRPATRCAAPDAPAVLSAVSRLVDRSAGTMPRDDVTHARDTRRMAQASP